AAGQATHLMTGAPLPEGADAVVPVERCHLTSDGHVQIDALGVGLPALGAGLPTPPVRPGQHIMRRGQEMRKGEVVLRKGAVLGPTELGVLATVGRNTLQACP